jgi:hypothetical protein
MTKSEVRTGRSKKINLPKNKQFSEEKATGLGGFNSWNYHSSLWSKSSPLNP